MSFIDDCRKFVSIDSSPECGTEMIVKHAAEMCHARGLEIEIHKQKHMGMEQANLIARVPGGPRANEVVLLTHLDTANPGPFPQWTKTNGNPFEASIYGDTIYGLGVAKSKLDFLCKLNAIANARNHIKGKAVALVGTFGEDSGMVGSRTLLAKGLIKPKMVLIGQPTDLRLIHASKGYVSGEIVIPVSAEENEFKAKHDQELGSMTQSQFFKGVAAHAAHPQVGENAILKMLEYIRTLPSDVCIMHIEGGISFNTVPAFAIVETARSRSFSPSLGAKITSLLAVLQRIESEFVTFGDAEFDPPHPTFNIGLVRMTDGGVKLGGSCRLTPSVPPKKYKDWQDIVEKACKEVGARFRVTDFKPPFRNPPNSPLLNMCTHALTGIGRTPEFAVQAVANEASIFGPAGIDCLVFGPGQGIGNSHAPDENIKISDLESATKFYEHILLSI